METTGKRPLIGALSDDELFRESDFLADVDIDPSNLQSAIVRHSGMYWKYGKLHAVAMRLEEDVKLSVETKSAELNLIDAELDAYYRDLAGDRRITERSIRASVQADEKHITAEAQVMSAEAGLTEAKFTRSILALAEKVFARRSDLLQTLGYMDYAERGSHVEISKREFAQVEMRKSRREIERAVATSRREIESSARRPSRKGAR